jgi:hypothetical protein
MKHMTPNIIRAYNRLNQKIEHLFNTNGGLFKLTLILFACFSFIYFPEILRKRATNTWLVQDQTIQQFVNEKIQNPLKPFHRPDIGDHLSKRELRITPYLVGFVLQIEAIKLFYLQVILLFPLFIFLCLKTIRQLSNDSIVAFWGTIALIGCYVGNSFNYDTFFYDSYAYLGLIAACYFRNHWSMVPILVATYFVDERSVVPSTAIFFLNSSRESVGFYQTIILNSTFWRITFVILLYACIRFMLYINFDLYTPTGKGSGIELFTALRFKSKIPAALFSAMKLNVILIFLTFTHLLKIKKWILSACYFSVFSIIITVAISVEDVTRSLAYAFPLVILFYKFNQNTSDNKENDRLFICLISICNSLLPTFTLLLKLYDLPLFGWTNLI